MQDLIKSYLERDKFYEQMAAGWMQKSEIERLIREDYVKKYAPQLTNDRVEDQYKRVTSTVAQKVTGLDSGWLSKHEQIFRSNKDIENVCGIFCSKQRLTGTTDKLIDATVKLAKLSRNNQNSSQASANHHGTPTTAAPFRSNGRPANTGRAFSSNQGSKYSYQGPSSSCQWINGVDTCSAAQNHNQNRPASVNRPVTPLPPAASLPRPTQRTYTTVRTTSTTRAPEPNTMPAPTRKPNEKVDVNLERGLQPAIDEVGNLQRTETAYVNLQQNLKSWIPSSKIFTDKFVQYFKRKNPSFAEFLSFENPAVFFSPNNQYLRDFTSENSDLFQNAINNEVSAVLASIDIDRAPRNFEVLKKKDPEVFQQLTDRATLEVKIKRTIQPIQNCITNMQALVANTLRKREENEDEKANMKAYFDSNKCVADEICIKTNRNQSKISGELQVYIAAYKKSQTDSLAGNKNIKDEIDESVYDVVQNIVQRNINETLAECFVLYLRRTNDLDEIYSSSLLFDESQLSEKIEPFMLNYERDYLRSLHA